MIQIAILAAISAISYFSPWVVVLYPFWIFYSMTATKPSDSKLEGRLKELEARVSTLEMDEL